MMQSLNNMLTVTDNYLIVNKINLPFSCCFTHTHTQQNCEPLAARFPGSYPVLVLILIERHIPHLVVLYAHTLNDLNETTRTEKNTHPNWRIALKYQPTIYGERL